MSSMINLPREVHFNVAFQMFSFLKSKHNGVTAFDPAEPGIDQTQFRAECWSKKSYGPCKECVPSNLPAPRRISFTMRAFFESDHAEDSVTRCSRTEFIAFLNNATIVVYSNKQGSCETSSFVFKFTATKSYCECLRGLRH